MNHVHAGQENHYNVFQTSWQVDKWSKSDLNFEVLHFLRMNELKCLYIVRTGTFRRLDEFKKLRLAVCPFPVQSSKMANVFVLIYSFRFLKFFWLEHTEVRVNNRDIAYGKDGITIRPAQTRPDMILKRIIDCGRTEIEDLDLVQWLININQFFTREKYNLWWNNCRNFTQSLLTFLEPNKRIEGIIEYLNR